MLSLAACSTKPTDVESGIIGEASNGDSMADLNYKSIDMETSSFEFEGYMAVKSHIGTFDTWSGELAFDKAGSLVGAKGVIDATTVNTGIEGLNSHLKSDDFFDVDRYPKIMIEATSIDMAAKTITADLTFHGITKAVTFPVEFIENGVKADFLLDLNPFNIKHAGVDKEVRIDFTFMI